MFLPDAVAFSSKQAQEWTQAIVICGLSSHVLAFSGCACLQDSVHQLLPDPVECLPFKSVSWPYKDQIAWSSAY